MPGVDQGLQQARARNLSKSLVLFREEGAPDKRLNVPFPHPKREAQRRHNANDELASVCASLINAGAAERQSLVDKCNAAPPEFCKATIQIMNTTGQTCDGY